ncbi:hypothetical protein [Micromonospora sp. RV43]|uniref:hypothetical protein n=1 Tax=Micromonospora sp. RV43 TaxID=1661387 RepID=UPI00069FE705|nr:hypothetical protein [Micromonospora sp. RV43]
MSLVEHARRELELSGQFAEDPAYAQSIVAAVSAFASYGHSGGSAACAREQINTLLGFGTLSPLTDDPEDWVDVAEQSGHTLWQCRRNPEAFSEDGGKTYYLLSDREAGKTFTRRSIMRRDQVEKLRLRSRGLGAPGDGPEPTPVNWAVAD